MDFDKKNRANRLETTGLNLNNFINENTNFQKRVFFLVREMTVERRQQEERMQRNWGQKKAATKNVAENAANIDMTKKRQPREVAETTAAKLGCRKKWKCSQRLGWQGTIVYPTPTYLGVPHWSDALLNLVAHAHRRSSPDWNAKSNKGSYP